MEKLLSEREESPCQTCSVKDCPTRGLAQESSQDTLSSGRMLFSSVLVFLFPLAVAAVGAVFFPMFFSTFFSPEAPTKTMLATLQWAGAASGFLIGLVTSMMILKFWHKES